MTTDLREPPAGAWLRKLYEPLGNPTVISDPNSAETIKETSNTFPALKVSCINLVTDPCGVAWQMSEMWPRTSTSNHELAPVRISVGTVTRAFG